MALNSRLVEYSKALPGRVALIQGLTIQEPSAGDLERHPSLPSLEQ